MYTLLCLMYLFYVWLSRLFLAAPAFSGCSIQGLLSSCGVRASHCGGSSGCRAQVLGTQAPGGVAQGSGMIPGAWNLPGSGIEQDPPANAGATREVPINGCFFKKKIIYFHFKLLNTFKGWSRRTRKPAYVLKDDSPGAGLLKVFLECQ